MTNYVTEKDRFGENLMNPFIINKDGELIYTIASYCTINNRFYIDTDGMLLFENYPVIQDYIKKFSASYKIPFSVVKRLVKTGESYNPISKKYYPV